MPVVPDITLEPVAPYFDALGFDRMRPTGRWTLLQVAELRFTPAPVAEIRELMLTYGSNGRQALRIELNDTVLLDTTVDASDATATVPIPQSAWRAGLNRLRFVVPDTRRIRRGDPRDYGIVVKGMAFRSLQRR